MSASGTEMHFLEDKNVKVWNNSFQNNFPFLGHS